MSIGIFGSGSTLARALISILPIGDPVIDQDVPDGCDRYFFATGFLVGDPVGKLSDAELSTTFQANFSAIAARCDRIFDVNEHARICIIGSESGFAGSYDMAYAGAKAAMHLYIERKRLIDPGQQLVGIAPTVVWDSGMTQRREDIEDCEQRGRERRRGHWLAAMDVARLAHFLLYEDSGSISNTVVRMTGGNW